MKYGIILGVTIFIFSLLIVLASYHLFFHKFFIEINYQPTNIDKNELRNSELFIKDKLQEFDNNFFNALNGNKSVYNEMVISMRSLENYSYNEKISKNLKQFIKNSIDYYIKGLDAKITLSVDNVSEETFLNAYKDIEYNFSAAEATHRIAEHLLKSNDLLFFMPDIATKNIIETGSCIKNEETVEDYEIVFHWFVAFSALKASFNTEYLKLFYGKKFFSKQEIINTIYNMKNILNEMKKCNPPDYLVGINLDNYKLAFYAFDKKMTIAEEYGVSLFPKMSEINVINNNLNSYGDISEIISDTIGYDSFRTLALVVLFELYSKK